METALSEVPPSCAQDVRSATLATPTEKVANVVVIVYSILNIIFNLPHILFCLPSTSICRFQNLGINGEANTLDQGSPAFKLDL
jgi:hypothetical protein